MNIQRVLISALVILVASVALGAGSSYFVSSALQPDLSRPDPPPQPEAPQESAEEDLLSGSKAQLMDVAPEKFQPRDVARNPFLWPQDEESLLAQLDKQAEKAEQEDAEQQPDQEAEQQLPDHELKMVIIGELGKIALIDGQVLREGDTLGEARIKSIERFQVTLELVQEQEEFQVQMSEPPRMLAFNDLQGQEREQEESESPKIPSDKADPKEQMQYLLQEAGMELGG